MLTRPSEQSHSLETGLSALQISSKDDAEKALGLLEAVRDKVTELQASGFADTTSHQKHFDQIHEVLHKLLEIRHRPTDAGLFLQQLHFNTMGKRHEMIDRQVETPEVAWVTLAHADTGDTPAKISHEYCASWRIHRWLESDDSLLLVSGRAGCGKSTLMRHLPSSPGFMRNLRGWASGCKLIVGKYYFWQEGDPLQKSMEGLYRTLLYQAFEQAPELMTTTVPTKTIHPSHHDGTFNMVTGLRSFEPLNIRFLESTFQRLLENAGPRYRLLFLIDGLDEVVDDCSTRFWESYRDVAQKIVKWSKNNGVKFLLSFRPHDTFLDAFEGVFIHLHCVNHEAISSFTQTMLRDRLKDPDAWSHQFDHTNRDSLPRRVADRSEGIFLWARFVSLELVEAMNEGRSTEPEIFQLLDHAPKEMNDLYRRMISSEKQQRPGDVLPRDIIGLVAFRPDYCPKLQPQPVLWLKDLLNADPFPIGYPVEPYPYPCGENKYDAQYSDEDLAISRVRRLTSGIVDVGYNDAGFSRWEFFHKTAREFVRTNLTELDPAKFSASLYARYTLLGMIKTKGFWLPTEGSLESKILESKILLERLFFRLDTPENFHILDGFQAAVDAAKECVTLCISPGDFGSPSAYCEHWRPGDIGVFMGFAAYHGLSNWVIRNVKACSDLKSVNPEIHPLLSASLHLEPCKDLLSTEDRVGFVKDLLSLGLKPTDPIATRDDSERYLSGQEATLSLTGVTAMLYTVGEVFCALFSANPTEEGYQVLKLFLKARMSPEATLYFFYAKEKRSYEPEEQYLPPTHSVSLNDFLEDRGFPQIDNSKPPRARNESVFKKLDPDACDFEYHGGGILLSIAFPDKVLKVWGLHVRIY